MNADPLRMTSAIAASGLAAQSTRMRIVSENVANAESTGVAAGADPYRRKIMSFRAAYDRAAGAPTVAIDKIGPDKSPFRIERDPGHPAADAAGQVKYPNVSPLVELADMREASRAYEANLQILKQTREIFNMHIDLLRSSS